ncbi:hypothetical protein BDZ91DRAFT_782366 [Kalaharituber pfeilii]|nr:hypothetical protein BDZ91DRAFT_782366 [Kalaharituber pfeilii]
MHDIPFPPRRTPRVVREFQIIAVSAPLVPTRDGKKERKKTFSIPSYPAVWFWSGVAMERSEREAGRQGFGVCVWCWLPLVANSGSATKIAGSNHSSNIQALVLMDSSVLVDSLVPVVSGPAVPTSSRLQERGHYEQKLGAPCYIKYMQYIFTNGQRS